MSASNLKDFWDIHTRQVLTITVWNPRKASIHLSEKERGGYKNDQTECPLPIRGTGECRLSFIGSKGVASAIYITQSAVL